VVKYWVGKQRVGSVLTLLCPFSMLEVGSPFSLQQTEGKEEKGNNASEKE
jgi:hypothetical protein